jgi:hypothetical protein
MRVITEFVREDLSQDQLMPVISDLAPALQSILLTPQVCWPPILCEDTVLISETEPFVCDKSICSTCFPANN